MSEPSKLHSNPRRHAQLVSSSSRLFQSNSRKELNAKASISFEKHPASKTQTTGVPHGETGDVGGSEKQILKPLELVKTPISHQRISVTSTPQASVRGGHKTGAEKENVKIGCSRLRQTIARCTTSRRTVVPLGNSSLAKVKNTPRSKGAHNDRSPFSATPLLSSRKSPSVLEQKRAVTKSRAALSARSLAQSITDLPSEFDQPIRTSASLVTGAYIRTLPLEGVSLPSTNLGSRDAPKACFSTDADSSVSIEPDTSEAVRVSRSPPALALASAPPNMVPDGIGTSTICGSPLTPELSSTCPAQLFANNSNTRTEGAMMSHSVEDPTKSFGDESENRANGQGIEFTEIPTTVEHTCDSGAVGDGTDSRPSSTTDIATATLASNRQLPASSGLESQATTKSNSFSKLKRLQGTQFCESTTVQNPSPDVEETDADILRSRASIRADISDVAPPDPGIPPPPPPTPTLGLSPAPSASTSPITALSSSSFLRLFTEHTTTYAHLGFGAKNVLGSSARHANENSQAERTQKELERLRAAGSGLVLARARVFGQTLRASNSVLSAQERSTVESVVEMPAVKEPGNDTSRETNEVLVQGKGISESVSGSVRMSLPPPPPPPPPPSLSSAIVTPTLKRTESLPKTRPQSKRILGCADLVSAVAMAETLWKTKNFVLE